MSMIIDPRLHPIVAAQPHPLLFATISGAHLYGFPSPDSDYDLRGVHVLPLRDVLGLEERAETIEVSEVRDGLELDLVTHDAEKFFRMLLKRNGYVLEQLCSPLIVQTTPEHAELLTLVPQLLTRHHAHHYLGFAETQWRLFLKEEPRRVKPLLYVFRVLLTGTHLMQAGMVEANLVTLNETFQLTYIPDLMARKLAGPEHGALADADVVFFEQEFVRMRAVLEAARDATHLPETPSARSALNDLLVRLRLARG
jgi:predicted nucleotidyltransferase